MSEQKFDYKVWLDEQEFEKEIRDLLWTYGHPRMELQEAEKMVAEVIKIFTSYKPPKNSTT